MSTLQHLLATAPDAASYARGYASRLAALLQELDFDAVGRFVDVLADARANGRNVYLVGNGGSASTAGHWAVDLLHGTAAAGAPPLRVFSLSDNVGAVTALANDRAYAEVFVGQLEKLMRPGDVLVAISASGSSPNVVAAVDYANAHGGRTVGVLGFDGGALRTRCALTVLVSTPAGEYGPVEDIHLVLNHIVSTWLKTHP